MPTQFPPEQYAQALRKQLKISGAVNLFELTQHVGLEIREVEPEGFEGVLVRKAGKLSGIVAISKTIREAGRKRFCIAHEIGHYFLPGHGMSKSICTKNDIEIFPQGVIEQEVAANRFAAELLLPASEVTKVVRQHTATIETAKLISESYQTSLTAATFRCVQLTTEPCVVIESKDGIIRRFQPNDQFTGYIRIGQRLSEDSLAINLKDEPAKQFNEGSVAPAAWLSSQFRFRDDLKVWEDSILLPYYNTVLTILTLQFS